MMTEKEAKEKWCPFARVSDKGLGNRYPRLDDLSEGHAFARCISSECTVWQWTRNLENVHVIEDHTMSFRDLFRKHVDAAEKQKPEGEGWELRYRGRSRFWQRLLPKDEWEGECGLASKPE